MPISIVLTIGFVIVGTVFAQLPPEIQLDRYLVRAERQIEERDFTGAKDSLNRVLGLQKQHEIEVPEEFSLMHAQVSLGLGLHAEAIASAMRYLRLAGRAGEHYRAALELLDRAERDKSAAEAAAAREQAATEARPAWESICSGDRESPSCWKELESHPDCYVWNPNVPQARSVRWTGDCIDWRADGAGTLYWKGGSNPWDGHAESTGLLRGGKHNGSWVIHYYETVAEGSFKDGDRHGRWVFLEKGGSRWEGSYVNGLRHGRWNHFDDSGHLFAWTDYVRGVNQFGEEK
jgi:hypothetical protein